MTEREDINTTQRVMIIDDDPRLLRLLARTLKRWKIESEQRDRVEGLAAAIEAYRPNVVLLDLQMGSEDGVAALHQIRTLDNPPGVVLMSGVDSKLLGISYDVGVELGLPMLGSLSKPFSPVALRELIDGEKPVVNCEQLSPVEIEDEDALQALRRGEIAVFYQPKIDLGDNHLTGVEALVRWRHPRLGLLNPDNFIPQLQRLGQMQELTEMVLRQGLDDLADWRSDNPELNLAVNVPPQLLENAQLPDMIMQELRAHDLPSSALIMEVTEAGDALESTAMRATLGRLRLLGIEIAIDDFGTGVSSLHKLYAMPFSILKLDKSFVIPLGKDREARTIVGQTLELARCLGMETVAEGIEDVSTLQALSTMGCDQGQGFYMGKPMAAKELMQWYRQWQNRSSAMQPVF